MSWRRNFVVTAWHEVQVKQCRVSAHKTAEKISRSVCGEMGTRSYLKSSLFLLMPSFRLRVRIVSLSLSPSSDTVNKPRENMAV